MILKNVTQLFELFKKTSVKHSNKKIDTLKTDNLVTASGTIIYNIAYLGYYNIVSDDGTLYTPFNIQHFPKIMRNNMRVRFTLQVFPEVQSIHQNGKTSRLINAYQLNLDYNNA